MNFRITYINSRVSDGHTNINRARRGSVAGATNTLHRIHSSKQRELVRFTINEVEYDMPWMKTRKEVLHRLNELVDFHQAFYGEAT